jgi:flavodoxin
MVNTQLRISKQYDGDIIMNVGIIYFSKTGNTRKIAEMLSEKLKTMKISSELIEIKSSKIPGVLGGGRAAMKQKDMPILNEHNDLSKYDLFLFGSPIWAWRPSPYIHSFLKHLAYSGKKPAGVFFTCAGDRQKHPKAGPMITDQLKEFDIQIKSHISLRMSKGEISEGEDQIPEFINSLVKK